MGKLIIFIVIIMSAVYLIKFFARKDEPEDISVYQKKKYIFDSNAEFSFYKKLLELYGDRFQIFTQVQYSHLIEPKNGLDKSEHTRYRNKLDRKSADFVICDSNNVVPLLIIELDGPSHNWKSRQANDKFKNEVAKTVGLPLLRIKVQDMNKDLVKTEINKALALV